jgi:DNA polymerase (family 10)
MGEGRREQRPFALCPLPFALIHGSAGRRPSAERDRSALEIRGENPFKSRLFASAARTIQGLEDEDITPLVRSRAIADLPGIGSTTLAVLADLVETGDSEYLDHCARRRPKACGNARIPGLGPTRIHRIHEGLGLETVADLRALRETAPGELGWLWRKDSGKDLRGIAVLREISGS